jgi:hypothetical protein
MVEVNLPDVLPELSAAFEAYERALQANDIEGLNFYSHADIARFRRGRGPVGRQSQTWVRTDQGWKIVSAHVSFLAR